jgi:hypothetical protein
MFQVKKLGDNDIGYLVVNFCTQEDDAFSQQQ